MGWFKVDDQLAFHRKTLKAGNSAMGLWVRSGSWLRGQPARSTPGVLTVAEARLMGSAADVKRLLDAGLWHACRHDGEKAVRFHDWEAFQPEKSELAERRTLWAERKKRQRHHRAGDHSLCLPGYCDALEPPPDDLDAWPGG